MVHQKTEAIARIIEIPEDYPDLMLVRCPFCGEIHQHRINGGDKLLGVPLHRGAGNCWPFKMELGRPGLRKKRRQQLEEGKALYEQCGGNYSVPLSISLYSEFKGGQLVGLRLGEMRKMRIRKGRAKA